MLAVHHYGRHPKRMLLCGLQSLQTQLLILSAFSLRVPKLEGY